jgi:hypothetical protein
MFHRPGWWARPDVACGDCVTGVAYGTDRRTRTLGVVLMLRSAALTPPELGAVGVLA